MNLTPAWFTEDSQRYREILSLGGVGEREKEKEKEGKKEKKNERHESRKLGKKGVIEGSAGILSKYITHE